MKRRLQTILLAVLITWLQLTAMKTYSADTDPYPTIDFPVYSGGYDIEYSFNRLKETKELRYKVQTKYPAGEVIEFYDAALNGRGWKPSFEICQRHWASLDNDSPGSGFRARRLYTSWVHPQFRLQLSLLLEYQPPDPTGRDEVVVQCRLQPQPDKSNR